MCGGGLGKVFSSVTDALGLTKTKKAEKGFDVEAAAEDANNAGQATKNLEIAKRRQRSASTVLASSADTQKKTTLGG